MDDDTHVVILISSTRATRQSPTSLGTPKSVMIEQLGAFAREVMPKLRRA